MNEIEYYKTYKITYKLSTKLGDITVSGYTWPSIDDDGELIWTHCEDNSTIILNKYIIDYKLV